MLEFLNKKMDGDTWEELISKCYRMRYQSDGFQRVPASYKGDYGIEGYTKTGIAFQCYCPEKDYSDDDLYANQRDKLTADIKKLIDNGAKLKGVGINTIKEWHFVTPDQRDKRILEHCTSKRDEVRKFKMTNGLDHISDSFEIILKVKDDFSIELTRLIFLEKDYKLDFALRHTGQDVDWTKCPSEKIENIKRKIRALMKSQNSSIDENAYNTMVNLYGSFYIKGIELLNKIKQNYPEIYEGIISLAYSSRTEVEIKCNLNSDASINKSIFNEIMNEFERKLSQRFSEIITIESVAELKHDLISSWLADCPMDFR
ncbi:MAG: hypothetical protein N2645_20975 [Clostridia bacterium]|nr:hypothetical protein [Clostridia bacterium]